MKPIDYTRFNNGDSSSQDQKFNKRWWLVPKEERAQSVIGVVNLLAKYDSKRESQYRTSTRLYGNTNLPGMNGLSYTQHQSAQSTNKERISYNVAQSATDTVTSKMVKNKPKPLFLTSGGNYKLQRRAKKLDKFVEGIFYENEAYKLGNIIFRDACVFGDGIVHVFDRNGRVAYERVIPGELYVDWVESFYGEPRQIHRVKNVDREVLIDLFPDHRALILEAPSASASLTGSYQNVADQVTVVESWRLPSGPEANDGIHTINIENGNLFDEEWKKSFFPFAKFSWCPRMYGYWSQGLVEQIQNIQFEINKILWVIQRSMHLAGSFKVWIKNGSKFPKEHVNNEIGAIIQGDEPPQYLISPVVPPEYYSHLVTLKNSAYEQAGISQLSANSQKPAGLNSGKALREYNDIETDRFMTTGQAYERFFLDLSKLTVDCARDTYSRNKKFKVKVPGKKFIETIDWKDVSLEDDEFYLKIFPISSLPNDPTGRLQTIQEYVQAGFITPRTARRLLDMPDLEQIEDLANSTEDYLHDILEKIVDEGIYTPPEPQDDLPLARELALEYYAQGKCNGLEEEKLDQLRTFMTQIDVLSQKAQPPAISQGMPQAQPLPPPQSDLIPNVSGVA